MSLLQEELAKDSIVQSQTLNRGFSHSTVPPATKAGLVVISCIESIDRIQGLSFLDHSPNNKQAAVTKPSLSSNLSAKNIDIVS
jgi:hypothetical protein